MLSEKTVIKYVHFSLLKNLKVMAFVFKHLILVLMIDSLMNVLKLIGILSSNKLHVGNILSIENWYLSHVQGSQLMD